MPPPRAISFDRETGEAVIEDETGQRQTVSVYDSPAAAEIVAASGFDPSGAPDAAEQFMLGQTPAQMGDPGFETNVPERFGFPGFGAISGDERLVPGAHPGGALPPGPAMPIPGAPTPLAQPGIYTAAPTTPTSALGEAVTQQEADVAAARRDLAALGSDGRPVTSLTGGATPAPGVPGAAPARPGGVRRGGSTMTASSSTTAPGPPGTPAPGTPGGLSGSPALDDILGFADQRGALAKDRAAAHAQSAMDRQHILDGMLQDRQELEAERQQAMGQARDRYRRALDRVQSMSVEPDRWFADRGALGAIGSAIAVGLGAVGSGLAGGPNVALGLIQSAIDRDIEAQRTNIDNAQQNLDSEGNLVTMLQQEFQSREAAEQAAHAIMLEQAAQQAAQYEAEFEGQEAGIAAGELRRQILDQAAQAQQAAEQAEVDRALERARALVDLRRADAEATIAERRASRTGAGGAGRPIREEAYRVFRAHMEGGGSIEDARAAAIAAGMPPDLAATLGHAPITGEGRARIDAFDAAVRGLESELDGYDVRGESPAGVGLGAEIAASLPFGEFLLSPEGRRMRQLRDNVVDAFVRARSGAQTSPGEYDNLLHIVRGAGTVDELRTGIEMMREAIRAMLGRSGRGSSAAEERQARDDYFGAETVDE